MTRNTKDDLFRILPFHHLVEAFEKRELSLSCPKSWDDPYESQTGNVLLNSIFAQCWSRKGISDAMWRIYSPDRFSVRIRTTATLLGHALSKELSDADRFVWRMDEVEYKTVRKLREHLATLRSNDDPEHALASIFAKRRAFEHESEYRLAVFDKRPRKNQDRLSIRFDPHKMILGVLIDPRAPDTILEIFKFYLERELHFKGAVKKSSLYTRES